MEASVVTKKYRQVIQLELNEISPPIIDKLVGQGLLPNFEKCRRVWKTFKTSSEQRYEELEPWIQWTTAHTGKSFAEHKVFHLSDVDRLKHPQIWESLSAQGIESCTIGAMNAARGESTRGGIFLPDPWAKGGRAYPESLQSLYDLLASQVQRHSEKNISPAALASGLKELGKLRIPPRVAWTVGTSFLRSSISRTSKWRLASTFDYLLFEIFRAIYGRTNFRFYSLFLNSNAHYQHHFWREFDKEKFDPLIHSPDCHRQDNPIVHGYKLYDWILGEVQKLAKDALIIVASGLSQRPFTEKESQGGMRYHRLKSHQQFLNKIGFPHLKAYPLMSRDWQITSGTKEELDKAESILNNLRVGSDLLFKTSRTDEDRIFVETSVTRKVESHEAIRNGTEDIELFSNCFLNTAIKSGHHHGEGLMWISEPRSNDIASEVLPLKELFKINLQSLGLEA